MKQLGMIDSAFINLEHPNTPQHIGGFGIYDPSTAPDGKVRFKQVIADYEKRLNKIPVFRTRLVEVPMGLGKPYWVTDENFDVEFHLRHIALPKPGDWRQLCIQVARLHARPLDMSRPLWECYVIEGLDSIEGLPDGAFAIYTKIHHSLIDGNTGQSFLQVLHDTTATPSVIDPATSVAKNEYDSEITKPLQFASNVVRNNIRGNYELVKSGINLTKKMWSTLSDIRNKKITGLPLTGPQTRFDDPVGPHRVFQASLFQLDDFKAIRKLTATKVNDVAVTIIAGAVRRYLEKHHELPEESIVASLPVNTRQWRENDGSNNQIALIMTPIHTQIADPIERLLSVSRSTTEAKKQIDTPLSEPAKVAGIFNPWISKTAVKWYVDKKITRKNSLGGGIGIITNVQGPSSPLYSAGAELVHNYAMGFLNAGSGIFHAVFSMNGTVTISALADRDIMPDPEFYRECLEASFAELYDAVLKVYNENHAPPAVTADIAEAPAKPKAKKPAVKKAANKLAQSV